MGGSPRQVLALPLELLSVGLWHQRVLHPAHVASVIFHSNSITTFFDLLPSAVNRALYPPRSQEVEQAEQHVARDEEEEEEHSF